jgi:hypothetical protein
MGNPDRHAAAPRRLDWRRRRFQVFGVFSRETTRALQIDLPYFRMRAVRAHEAAVELPGKVDVRGKATLAAEQAIILSATFEDYVVG